MEISPSKKKKLITGAVVVGLGALLVGAYFLAVKIAEVGYRSQEVEDTSGWNVGVEELESETALAVPKEVDEKTRFDGRKEGTSDLSDFGNEVENPYNIDSELEHKVLVGAQEYLPTVSSLDQCTYLSKGYYYCENKGETTKGVLLDAVYQRVFAITSSGAISVEEEKRFTSEFSEAYFSQGLGSLEGYQILQRGTVQDLTFGGSE